MKSTLSRRNFLHTTMGVAAAGLIGMPASSARAQQIPDPATKDSTPLHLSFGIVGVGMQGSGLLREAVTIPGMKCVAACDLYDERHTLSKEIAGAGIRTTRRYQDLLDSKDIDCIIVATPDHWHKKIVIDAVRAGKDVYCEKPMSHSIADGAEMVKAVQASGRVLQVGSQVVSSPLFIKAKEMIAAGKIGKVSLVELAMGRNDPNGAWTYPLPPGLSEDNVDWATWLGDTPKRPLDPVVFARWRSWRAYGSGIAGDLMVHLLSGMQCALSLSAIPDRAVASGRLIRYKDGREVPDQHLVLLEYGDMIVSLRVTLNTETPSVSRFMGSHGMIEIGSKLTWTPQLGIDLKPSYYDGGFPSAMRGAYEKQWHAENDAVIRKLPAVDNVEIFESAPSMDGRSSHLKNFFTAVQNRTPVEEDVVFGHHAAAACHMTNQSYYTQRAVTKEMAL